MVFKPSRPSIEVARKGRARTPRAFNQIGTRPPSRWGNAGRSTTPAPQSKPVTAAPCLVTHVAPSVGLRAWAEESWPQSQLVSDSTPASGARMDADPRVVRELSASVAWALSRPPAHARADRHAAVPGACSRPGTATRSRTGTAAPGGKAGVIRSPRETLRPRPGRQSRPLRSGGLANSRR